MDNTAPNFNKPNASPPPDDAPWLKKDPQKPAAPAPTTPHAPSAKPVNTPSPTPPAPTPPSAPKPTPTAAPEIKSLSENYKPAAPPPLPKPVSTIPSMPKTLPPQEPSKIMSWIKGLAVVFVGLIVFGALLLLFWPKLTGKSTNDAKTDQTDLLNSPVVPAMPNLDATSGVLVITSPVTPPTTSTDGTNSGSPTGTPSEDQTNLRKKLGQTVDFFLHDPIIFTDPKNPNHTYKIEVMEFNDSRCPKDVVCVWAGERGVKVKITDEQSGESQEIYLGTERALSVKALNLTLTLSDIDDGKGGTYAVIKVE